jgi:hypothetical protein
MQSERMPECNKNGSNWKKKKKKTRTTQNMERRSWRGLKDTSKGNKKQAGNGQRPSEKEEDCIGSQFPQQTVAPEKTRKKKTKKKKKKEEEEKEEEKKNKKTMTKKHNIIVKNNMSF